MMGIKKIISIMVALCLMFTAAAGVLAETAEETEDPAGPEEEPEKEPGKTSEEEPIEPL